MIDPNKVALYAQIANARISSESRELSPAQQGYANVIENLMSERGLDNMFAQSPSGIASFFEEASRRWEAIKSDYE